MKKLLFIILAFFNINAYAQTDSTQIEFVRIKNDNLWMMNELNGIQMQDIVCSDTLMKGKHFFLSIGEYKLGKLVKMDSLGLQEKKEITIVRDGDTVIYVIDGSKHVIFDDYSNLFKIMIGGKLKNDTLNLMIKYPGIGIIRKFKGSEAYRLREVQQCGNHRLKIALNRRIPILAYTGPFEMGAGRGSYCLLADELPRMWYEKFKIKHYYLFFLEIK